MSSGQRHVAAFALLALGAASALAACSGPETIVLEAAEASAAGDREAYVGCFTPRSQPILRAFFGAAERTNPALTRLGAGEVVVGEAQAMKPTPEGRQRAVVGVAERGSEGITLVVHDLAGVWRIDLIDSERVMTGLERAF